MKALEFKQLYFIPLVLILVLMCGCSHDSVSSSTKQPSSEVASNIVENKPQYKTVSIDDIANEEMSSVYIDVAGSGSCIKLEDNHDHDSSSWATGRYYYVSEDIVTNSDSIFYELCPSNGDRLITTISADPSYQLVTDTGFLGGTKKDVFEEDTEVNGIALTSTLQKDIEKELQAILSPDEIELVNLSFGSGSLSNAFFSHSPKTISYGFYDGTKWKEDSITINTPVYKVDSSTSGKENELGQEKTKDGYFVIDCSSLPKGDYIIYSGGIGNLIRIV